jgi:hypothetical protein
VALSTLVEDSYSNLLGVFSFIIYPDDFNFTAIFHYSLTANNLNLNQYYITKLLSIPHSKLTVGVIEDVGFHIYNFTAHMGKFGYNNFEGVLLAEIALMEGEIFSEQ